MPSDVSQDGFARLLEALDADRERAGARYEHLRRALIKFFEWRGAPFPEEHADDTFDRVSKRLAEGVAIANVGGYCYEVARLVCLEALKSGDRRRISVAAVDLPSEPRRDADDAVERERWLACLDRCLGRLSDENRRLILEYYRGDSGSRINDRKALADRLGLQRDALANRAQRIRNRLESCVDECRRGRTAI